METETKKKPELRHVSDTNFITREIETPVGKTEYKVLVIDRADKWASANEFQLDYDMPNPGTSSKKRFHLFGPSLREWEVLETENHIPPVEDNLSPAEKSIAEAKQKTALNNKYIAAFEIALRKKIPGETPEQKTAWLVARNPGEIQSLFAFVSRECLGVKDGQLLYDYSLDESKSLSAGSVVEFKDFDDWQVASECRHFFRINRFGQDFIVEFPIRSISADLKRQIDEETIEPEPPMVPARNPETKRYDPKLKAFNRNDPQWLKTIRAINQKRITMYLEACLPFEIPGNNQHEKYSWIADRLTGDVIRLNKFIEEELIGFRSRYDF